MTRPRFAWVLIACALGLALVRRRAPAQAPSARPPAWTLALLATHANEPASALWFVEGGAGGARTREVARVEHLPGAAVRGAAVGGAAVAVVADRAPGTDRSWGASLLLVAPGHPVRELCDRVAHASSPLALDGRRVLVSRGRAGPAAPAAKPATLRVDALAADEIDLISGAARTVWRGDGYLAHLAGVFGGEAILYVVAPEGARLLAVELASGRTRTLAALLPFARDFSLDDQGRLVFAERDEERSDLWVVDRLDLATSARERLWRSSVQQLAPHAWPGGEVVVAETGGLTFTAGRTWKVLGEGVDVVRALAPTNAPAGGPSAAVWHYAPGAALPQVAILDDSGRLLARVSVAGTHLGIIGFLEPPR